MKKNMKFIALGAVLLVAAIGIFVATSQNVVGEEAKTAAESVVKQATLPEGTDAWKIRCNTDEAQKAENKRGKCEVFQQLIVQESKQRFAEFAIGFPEGQNEARGIMILPLGVLLEPGVEMQIDDQQSFKFKIRYCEPGGCAAFLSLNDQVLGMMKGGKIAKVTLQSAQGKSLTFEMSLKGFGDVFKQVS
ncbi:MAG TPA: invasion associated locus B family protein [Alphaproteobacteria bacterium]|nr:invasion associated locus B family protein [Alphaproteobacteria bacterium]